MRIAYLCADPGIPVFGRKGASVHVQELIRAFRLLGHHVTLFALRLDEDRPDDLIDLPVYTLPAISRGPTPERERQAMALNQEVLALLHQTGPYDVIYERYSLWSTAGMAYAKSRRIVGILEVNAPLIEEQLTHRSLHHVAAAQSCATSTFCDANLITAVSQPVADYLSRFPAVQGKVVVVPNGVNPARFVPLAVRQRSRFTIGFVGTLKPWHGIRTLLEAYQMLRRICPASHLLIVGDGPMRHQIERFAVQHGLASEVTLTGAVAPTDVPAYLNQMDAAVAPYPQDPRLYFSPLKVYEYLAAGIPLVASRVGQLEALLQDNHTCLFCEPGDALSLAHTLRQLQDDLPLRQRLSVTGREFVVNYHTWAQVAKTVLGAALAQGVT